MFIEGIANLDFLVKGSVSESLFSTLDLWEIFIKSRLLTMIKHLSCFVLDSWESDHKSLIQLHTFNWHHAA